MKRPNSKHIALQVENWNLKHAIGSPVVVTLDSGEKRETVTISEAYILGGHSAVISLDGVRGYYLLDRVTPATAKAAEA